jgi:hypothetical protein
MAPHHDLPILTNQPTIARTPFLARIGEIPDADVQPAEFTDTLFATNGGRLASK